MTAPKRVDKRSSSSNAAWGWLQPVLDTAKGLPHPFLLLVILAGITWHQWIDQPTDLHYTLAGVLAFLSVGGFLMAWRVMFRSPTPPMPAVDEEPAEPKISVRASKRLPDEELRELYLRKLWDECYIVRTTTFKAATGQEAPEIDLSAVFTDLDIIEPAPQEPVLKERGDSERPEPALKTISNHPKLSLSNEEWDGRLLEVGGTHSSDELW